jgi:hypothetical protein
MFTESDDPLAPLIDKAVTYLGVKRAQLGEYGRHRQLFLSRCGKWVYKIPRNSAGLGANHNELRAYKTGGWIPVAKCRLIHVFDIPIIVMEYVKSVHLGSSEPDWVACVDCAQVGYTRKGKLVAYDMGG